MSEVGINLLNLQISQNRKSSNREIEEKKVQKRWKIFSMTFLFLLALLASFCFSLSSMKIFWVPERKASHYLQGLKAEKQKIVLRLQKKIVHDIIRNPIELYLKDEMWKIRIQFYNKFLYFDELLGFLSCFLKTCPQAKSYSASRSWYWFQT